MTHTQTSEISWLQTALPRRSASPGGSAPCKLIRISSDCWLKLVKDYLN